MHECGKSCINSIEIGRAALRIALTSSRVEETKVKERLAEHGIRSTAVDFGGEFIPSIVKIVERAVVAAQRQGLVTESHVGAGAVAGAALNADKVTLFEIFCNKFRLLTPGDYIYKISLPFFA